LQWSPSYLPSWWEWDFTFFSIFLSFYILLFYENLFLIPCSMLKFISFSFHFHYYYWLITLNTVIVLWIIMYETINWLLEKLMCEWRGCEVLENRKLECFWTEAVNIDQKSHMLSNRASRRREWTQILLKMTFLSSTEP
jgi:hypothetical protein